MSGDFVYLCVKTGGRLAELAYVELPSPTEGRYDDEFFRRLRETYSAIRGARNIRNVTSFKFVKVSLLCKITVPRLIDMVFIVSALP